MSDVQDLWDARLREAAIQFAPAGQPCALADRYDVISREEIVELTSRATLAMIDAGDGQLTIAHLDVAAEQMGVIA
ncbi:hypothetical protein [Natrononativus amylolyticus]|uniref:hypothetical protein n=1 Tax=Natrononativus amylolyticus TaxID=2963434 RepID=UPI0020CCA8E6|nr:hypothetical protein [Natrononativus amylolyticus]